MTYSIALCGIDGAGKTTLINKMVKESELPTDHMNKYMKNFYNHQGSRVWEILNNIEIIFRNIIWKYRLIHKSLIMDRCYICSLVYSNLEGFPDVAHSVKKWAVKPDIIMLMEPVEEIVPNAYRFTKEYKKVLMAEGYVKFFYGSYIFGRISYWAQRDYNISKMLSSYIRVFESL